MRIYSGDVAAKSVKIRDKVMVPEGREGRKKRGGETKIQRQRNS